MLIDKNIPILVVDDYPVAVHAIRGLLRQLGYGNVDEAANGAGALEKMDTKSYKVILSDWNMEPITGLELIKKLRGEGNDVPFIMITSNSALDQELEAKAAGVTDFLRKPVDIADLRAMLHAILGA